MFSSFRGKGAKPADSASASSTRGLEVIEDDPDTAWGLWDSALADQESRFGEQADPAAAPSAIKAPPPQSTADMPTQPDELQGKSPEDVKREALAVVEMHHHRIANTIRTMWGYKECSVYIYKLIMNGGDGMGQARVGFNQDAAEAMLVLAELHDTEFGAVDTGTGFGSLDRPR
jgi:hypothetical protein